MADLTSTASALLRGVVAIPPPTLFLSRRRASRFTTVPKTDNPILTTTPRDQALSFRLVRHWKLAIECAINAFMEVAQYPHYKTYTAERVCWSIGLTDADCFIALTTRNDDGFEPTYKFILDISHPTWTNLSHERYLLRLLAIAKHEVTHIAEPTHGEGFLRLYCEIDQCLDPRHFFARADRRITTRHLDVLQLIVSNGGTIGLGSPMASQSRLMRPVGLAWSRQVSELRNAGLLRVVEKQGNTAIVLGITEAGSHLAQAGDW